METKHLSTIVENFLKELKLANSGRKTSLPFLIHHLPSSSLSNPKDILQVLAIGGTIYQNAILKKEANDNIVILKKAVKPLPVFNTKEEFLSFIKTRLNPEISVLALNFAYPLQPVSEDERLDGILMDGAKENSFKGLVGEKICREIEKYIHKTLKRKITVACANDTVCLLLSGLTKYKSEELAAGVVGTGVNFAFFQNDKRLVNLESGEFDKFPISSELNEVDKQSKNPGKHLFEKQTSGAYLYKYFNLAIDKGILSAQKIDSTYELSILAKSGNGEKALFAKKLLEKSAQLIACQMGAITLFKDRDMKFVMSGSFFWDKEYKKLIEKSVKQLSLEYDVEFVKIDNAEILGAAKLF